MYGGGILPQIAVYLNDKSYDCVRNDATEARTSTGRIIARLVDKHYGGKKP